MSLQHLKIDGPVSVRPVIGKVLGESYRYLILGPTGVGKSSYIEAIAGTSHGLQISGNQLASVTQSVTAYLLVNVTRSARPVYIIDTPGFSDSKISQGEIVGMVQRWREDNATTIDNILFLTPITATRLEGSKRRTLRMMKELLGEGGLGYTTFVTTMWDQVANENAKQRAESNFTQLETVILKDWIIKGARMTRFKNDQPSALEALDSGKYLSFYFSSRPALLYHDLHERISTALHEKQMIEEQLNNPGPTINDTLELNILLKENQADNEDLLLKFIGQLQGYYEEPPKGYEDAHAEFKAVISAHLGNDLRAMKWRAQKRRARLMLKNTSFRVHRRIEESTTSIANIFKRKT